MTENEGLNEIEARGVEIVMENARKVPVGRWQGGEGWLEEGRVVVDSSGEALIFGDPRTGSVCYAQDVGDRRCVCVYIYIYMRGIAS
jgi:hypothetical protein